MNHAKDTSSDTSKRYLEALPVTTSTEDHRARHMEQRKVSMKISHVTKPNAQNHGNTAARWKGKIAVPVYPHIQSFSPGLLSSSLGRIGRSTQRIHQAEAQQREIRS